MYLPGLGLGFGSAIFVKIDRAAEHLEKERWVGIQMTYTVDRGPLSDVCQSFSHNCFLFVFEVRYDDGFFFRVGSVRNNKFSYPARL